MSDEIKDGATVGYGAPSPNFVCKVCGRGFDFNINGCPNCGSQELNRKFENFPNANSEPQGSGEDSK